ncbi:MAG: hypothetical protein Q9200_002510 [Gallowayella weberi]
MLQWLVYSLQPLHFGELMDILAVDLDRLPRFDTERRIPNPEALLRICSSLLTIGTGVGEADAPVKLAHASVREYLTSNDILAGDRAVYAVESFRTHETIAEDCLAYLIHISSEIVFEYDGYHFPHTHCEKLKADFPLLSYVIRHWTRHARIVKKQPEQLFSLMLEFLEPNIFKPLVPLVETVHTESIFPFDDRRLMLAISVEFPRLVQHLLKQGIDPNVGHGDPELGWTPLGQAIRNGDVGTIKVLLDLGARVYGGFALSIAAAEGSFEVVETLLAAGKSEKVPSKDTCIVTKAFVDAASGGHLQIAKILLRNGADINGLISRNGSSTTALTTASRYWDTSMVQLLLSKGASINLKGNNYALIAAAYRGHEEIVKILLAAGADVNVFAMRAGSRCPFRPDRCKAEYSLTIEISLGHTWTRILNGARGQMNVTQGAIQAASLRGYDGIVKLLLNHGADLNIIDDGTDDMTPSPLQCACYGGHESTARLLIDRGCDAHAIGGLYVSPLHAASLGGQLAIVELLLGYGVEVNPRTNSITPLEAALDPRRLGRPSKECMRVVVRRLLEAGAEPKTDPRIKKLLGETQ